MLTSILYLGPLEYCLWVQRLGLAWIILVGLDPTDVLTPPKAPLPQTLKRDVVSASITMSSKFILI